MKLQGTGQGDSLEEENDSTCSYNGQVDTASGKIPNGFGLAIYEDPGDIYEGLFVNGHLKEPYIKVTSDRQVFAKLNGDDGRKYEITFKNGSFDCAERMKTPGYKGLLYVD